VLDYVCSLHSNRTTSIGFVQALGRAPQSNILDISSFLSLCFFSWSCFTSSHAVRSTAIESLALALQPHEHDEPVTLPSQGPGANAHEPRGGSLDPLAGSSLS